MIEPRLPSLLRWQCLVLGASEAGDPPAALLPTEIDFYHTTAEMRKQELDMAEKDMLQVGWFCA